MDLNQNKIDGKIYSLLDFLIITLKDNSPELLDFAKQLIPLGDAVKIDLDVLSAKFKELEKILKTLETDLKIAKDFIQNLKENEIEETTANSKEDVILSCTKFYEKYEKIYIESSEIFTELSNDFSEVQENLKVEGKKFGEDDDIKLIEFIDNIFKFGKEFNEALKTMVFLNKLTYLGNSRKNKQKEAKEGYKYSASKKCKNWS